jgi:hypothetical protein
MVNWLASAIVIFLVIEFGNWANGAIKFVANTNVNLFIWSLIIAVVVGWAGSRFVTIKTV